MISKDIVRSQFSTKCRSMKASFNEGIIGVLGVAFKEYSLQQGDKDFKEMLITSTMAFEGYPTSW